MKCCSARTIRLQKINTARATAAAHKAVANARKTGVDPVKVKPTKTAATHIKATKANPCRNCGQT